MASFCVFLGYRGCIADGKFKEFEKTTEAFHCLSAIIGGALGLVGEAVTGFVTGLIEEIWK